MRAITATARARNNKLGPNESPEVTPWDGNTRIAVNVDSAPARAHASDDIRAAKMPAIRAASGLAAAERMATPYFVHRKKPTTAPTTTGAKNNMPEYAGVMRRAPISNTGTPG